MFLVAGCKYPTLKEAIMKEMPYKVNEVIDTKKINDVTIVLYTTKAKGKEVDHIKGPVLGVAFFEGNNEDGWEKVGPSGWEHYENDNYTIYHKPYTKYNKDGKLLIDIDVIYGEINNKVIQKIEIANENSKNFKEVKMIQHGSTRYYLGVGYHPVIRAVGSNDEVINQ